MNLLNVREDTEFAIDGAGLWRLYSAATWQESLSFSLLS